MESVCLVDSDDREEGEIVDDEFEDISDNSIIVPLYSGKCVSKEQLYALSLSSVSDLDNERRALRRRRRRKHRRHSSRNSSNTTSSGSSISVRKRRAVCPDSESDSDSDNRSLQKRLKEAIRIEETNDSQRNSLRARLEAMTKSDDIHNDLKSNETSTNEQNDLDNELNLLRMEALRTAVMNKFVYRKKRKQKTDHLSDTSQKSDTNKENTTNEMNKVCSDEGLKKKQDEENENVADEDEDVLRALLLASMSKKITKDNDKIITETLPLDDSTKNDKIAKQQVQLPKVKPLIISLNSDSSSESDDNLRTNEKNKIMDKMHFDLQNTVDKFLKEQRAKVEKEKLLTSTPIIKKTPNILEKSAVKLLPKVKQIEYQKLLQKIKNAEGNKRVRRSSKVNEIKLKMNNNKIQLTNKLEKSQQEQKTETVTLNKTLKDIHVNKNGRLQIQETYKILTPIVKKVNAANVERKKYNQRVKQLLEELTEAKKMLMKSHQYFTTSVKELLEKKALIDEKNKIKQKSTQPTKEPESNNELLLVNDVKTDFVEQKQLVISGDPNDIDVIYNIKHQNIEFPKYVSPLDNKNRLNNDDPLAILCPFDMSGMCRDPECKYKHIAEQ